MRILLAALVLILLALQLRLWVGDGSVAGIVRLEEKIAEQDAENDALAARNRELRREVGDLKTGADAVEERARSDLGLIRPGETFFLIVEEEK